MNKEFIPYEEALELKELGFDEPCFAYYNIMDYKGNIEFDIRICEGSVNYIEAPLYQQAFRWFREKYGLYSLVTAIGGGNSFDIVISRGTLVPISINYTRYITYEEAELACLITYIKIVKKDGKDKS